MPVHIIKSDGADFEDAISFLGQLKIISVDLESSGFDPHSNKILLLQLGNCNVQYVFDMARIGKAIQRIKPILEDNQILKILHNGKFDYKFIKADLGIEVENIFDTMIAEQLLQKGRKLSGFGLDDVTDKYTGNKLDKSIRETFGGLLYGESFSDAQLEYAAGDVRFLDQIMQVQTKLLQRDGLVRVNELERNVIQVTGDMELNGMKIDRQKWQAAEDIARAEKAKAQEALDKLLMPYVPIDMFGQPMINYNSVPQLLAALQKAIPDKTITSTKEEYLKEIDHPIVEAVLIYRGMEKRITTYGMTFLDNINAATGRLHTAFDQLNTDTGRYSSKEPNLQNIPAKDTPVYREAFVAFDENSVLVDADYASMEMRLLADLSKEPSWIEIFEKGKDMHCEIGSMIFGVPIRAKGTLGPDDPGENAHLRKITKSLNFGIGYGMGPTKLSREAKISFNEAKGIINRYWTSFPQVKKFFDDFVAETIRTKCIRSPYDNRLRWLESIDFDSKKEVARVRNMAMNFPMQSGNASITKLAMTKLRGEIKKQSLPVQVICTIHDEILLNAKKDIAPQAEETLVNCMKSAAMDYVKNVEIKVEANIAPYWKK